MSPGEAGTDQGRKAGREAGFASGKRLFWKHRSSVAGFGKQHTADRESSCEVREGTRAGRIRRTGSGRLVEKDWCLS